MRYTYNPISENEKFALQVYLLLVDNFEKTFYVGGIVRDMLLQKEVFDIDIATQSTPEQVVQILQSSGIAYDDAHKNFGVIIAKHNNSAVEITTFRTETYADSRYPKVTFTNSPETDSARRDFTINALYYAVNKGDIYDYHNGLQDIEQRVVRFIGDPLTRITEDPLRIVRAYRFRFMLQFSFDIATEKVLQRNMHLLKTISQTRIEHELQKTNDIVKNELMKVMHKNT